MELDVITIYVICPEFLQAMGHRDDPQVEMSDAEVMTTAIMAVRNYGGNYAKARKQLGCRQYIPQMLGKSQFSRRLNRLAPLFIYRLDTLFRKMVETSVSLVERLLPKHIHATNAAGFELKVILFILALSFDRLLTVAT